MPFKEFGTTHRFQRSLLRNFSATIPLFGTAPYLDVMTRLGEAFAYEDLEFELDEIGHMILWG